MFSEGSRFPLKFNTLFFWGLRTTEYTQISGGQFFATMGNPIVLDLDSGISFFFSADKPMLATVGNLGILVGDNLVS